MPGFAGFFYDEGRLVVRVKPGLAEVGQIRHAAGRFFERQTRGDAATASALQSAAENAEVRVADYDFRELHTWHRSVVPELMSRLWISNADIDERDNRIHLGVIDESNLDAVGALLEEMEVPAEAVVLTHRPAGARLHAGLRNAVSPRVGGVQVSRAYTNPWGCSLGWSVNRSNDSFWYFSSAGHCTEDPGAVDGDTIGQPDIDTPIGYEVQDVERYTGATGCNSGGIECDDADVAVMRYTIGSTSFRFGEVAWPSSVGGLTYSTTERVWSSIDPPAGMYVTMVGRTSGRQPGEVDRACDTQLFELDSVYHTCVWVADYESDGGDSGGPVLGIVIPFVHYSALGSHVGGFDAANEAYFIGSNEWMEALEDEFGSGTLCITVQCAPDPIVWISSGPTVLPSGLLCTWTTGSSGGVTPYTYTWSGVASGSWVQSQRDRQHLRLSLRRDRGRRRAHGHGQLVHYHRQRSTGASRLQRVTNSTLERRGDHGYLEVGSDRGGRSRRL